MWWRRCVSPVVGSTATGGLAEVVVRAMHAALGRRLLVLLDGHGFLLVHRCRSLASGSRSAAKGDSFGSLPGLRVRPPPRARACAAPSAGRGAPRPRPGRGCPAARRRPGNLPLRSPPRSAAAADSSSTSTSRSSIEISCRNASKLFWHVRKTKPSIIHDTTFRRCLSRPAVTR